jgi:major membrane immunogen (membrane-anchored lipoprotein)
MRKQFFSLMVALSLITTGLIYTIPSAIAKGEQMAIQQGQECDGTEILLKLKSGSASQENTILSSVDGMVVSEISAIGVKVICVPHLTQEKIHSALSHNPNIEFYEPNVLNKLSYFPNDPHFGDMWHHQMIHSEEAWDINTTTDVVIAVGDTGVYADHPDLNGSILPGFNTVDGTTDITDVNGHGTLVAGTAAAIGDNSNQIAGIAFDAKILPIKVSNRSDGAAYTSDLVEAIVYAADNGARIVTESYSVCGSDSVKSAANYMRSLGGLVTVAEGNSNSDAGNPDTPDIICVSATGQDDLRTNWSSYGSDVDVSAPGIYILTTNNTGGMSYAGGTSFSTPMTAGLLALIWGVDGTFTNDQVEQILKDSAIDKGDPGWDKYYGWGRIDAGAALELATADDEPPVVSIISPEEGSYIFSEFEIQTSAVDNVGVTRIEIFFEGDLIYSCVDSETCSTTTNADGLPDGEYEITATAYDAAGNFSTTNITVVNDSDTEPPVVSIISPEEGSYIFSEFEIQTSAVDNVGVTRIEIFFEGDLIYSCVDSETCSTTTNADGLPDGEYEITATAYDVAGNSDTTTITVTKESDSDIEPPVVSIDSPIDGSFLSKRVVISTSATDNEDVARIEIFFDGELLHTCVNSKRCNARKNTKRLPDGEYDITATAYDVAGNSDTTTITVTKESDSDIEPPVVSIDSPIDGSFLSKRVVISTSATDNEDVARIEIFFDGELLHTCVNSKRCNARKNTKRLPDGEYDITATAYDAAGNSDTTTITVTKESDSDTESPSVRINSPVDGSSLFRSVIINTSATDNIGVARMEVFFDGKLLRSCVNSKRCNVRKNTKWLPDGEYEITATAYDAAGNSDTTTITVTKESDSDTESPSVRINSPVDGSSLFRSVIINTSATDNIGVARMEVFFDGKLLRSCVNSKRCNVRKNTKWLPDGEYEITATAYDAVGNSDTTTITVIKGAGE